MKTGIVLGHSFVLSFKHYLENKSLFNKVEQHLRVSHHVSQLDFYGISGASVDDLECVVPYLSETSYDFLIIDIGSNDLANCQSPLSTAFKVTEFADKIIKNTSIKHIALCSVLCRGSRIPVTFDKFSKLVSQYNQILKTLCEAENYLTYHTHRGFWDQPIETWSRDRVHVNSAEGRRKYAASLRRAIYGVLSHINKRTVSLSLLPK